MICEPSKIKAKYKLAIVEVAHKSKDDCVRPATLRYTNIRCESVASVLVERNVQRLVLALPVEEQDTPLTVKACDTHVEVVCCSDMKAGVE